MAKEDDYSVLNSIFRGAESGGQAVHDILPQVEDYHLRQELLQQKDGYGVLKKEAADAITAIGKVPSDTSQMQKLGMKLGVMLNTAGKTSSAQIAGLVIKGSTTGIMNMTKVLNRYPKISVETSKLGTRLITMEKQYMERLKAYL